ncbi:MAG: sulfatase [Phycisphaerae bacterium]|nr:sulfatase [Phycisphaerae bacterium]
MILPLLLLAQAAADSQPNMILFIVDDLGWQDTSVPFHTAVTEFNERYHTPNLERLAASGVKFTNAYASAPVCTPTRTSIMTGMSPGQSRITYWTLRKDTDTSRNRDLVKAPPWNMNGLQEDDVTLPSLLADAGYRTIHVGKAHFGAHGTSGSDPLKLGFDVNIAGHGSGAPSSYLGVHHFSRSGRDGEPGKSSAIWDVPGLEKYHGKDIYLTEALAIEATRQIEDAIDSGVPFFMNMAPYAVHTPIMPNHRHLDRYEDLDSREAAYATMIESYDEALGEILKVLESRGTLENTMIIFTSDNGGLSAHARGGPPHVHNAPLRSGKGSAYEGGTRVPTIIAWPARIPGGTVCHDPIVSQDFFPTLMEVSATPIPEGHVSRVEGISLVPLLGGNSPLPRPICWNQPHQWGASGPGIEPFTSIRLGDHKLIYFHAGRNFELYDLGSDPSESKDMARTKPEVTLELAGAMADWCRNRQVQLSLDKETGMQVEDPLSAATRWLEQPND